MHIAHPGLKVGFMPCYSFIKPEAFFLGWSWHVGMWGYGVRDKPDYTMALAYNKPICINYSIHKTLHTRNILKYFYIWRAKFIYWAELADSAASVGLAALAGGGFCGLCGPWRRWKISGLPMAASYTHSQLLFTSLVLFFLWILLTFGLC